MTPKWAQDLTINTLLYLEGRGLYTEIPDIRWRHGTHLHSSGITYYNRQRGIAITAGKNRTDQKLVLLHELAHWVRPSREAHTEMFWDLAWELYRWAKLPIRYCLSREVEYRKGALAAYHRNRKA